MIYKKAKISLKANRTPEAGAYWGLIPHLNSGRVSVEWQLNHPIKKHKYTLDLFLCPKLWEHLCIDWKSIGNAVRKLPRDEVTWILKVTENIRLTSLYRNVKSTKENFWFLVKGLFLILKFSGTSAGTSSPSTHTQHTYTHTQHTHTLNTHIQDTHTKHTRTRDTYMADNT